MCSSKDFMLYVLSGKGQMSWREFKSAHDYLYTNDPSRRNDETDIRFCRNETVRSLAALGHCDIEFSVNSQMIYCTPPLLARLPSPGLPEAVLVGARFPETFQLLSDACKSIGGWIMPTASVQPILRGLLPTRVVVEAEYGASIAEIARSVGLGFEKDPPAWSILNYSASVDSYADTLTWREMPEINWLRKDFSFDSLTFANAGKTEKHFRLSGYTDPVRSTSRTLLWKGNEAAEVDRDWARYLALREAGMNVIFYDAQRLLFLHPRTVPLPTLLARSLVLCSGYVPYSINVGDGRVKSFNSLGWLGYERVPLFLAEKIARKLGQNLTVHSRIS